MALKSRGHTNLGFHCKVKVHQLCAERSPPTFLRGTQRIMNLFEPLQFCIKLHSRGHQPLFLCRKKNRKSRFQLLVDSTISLTGFSFPQVSGVQTPQVSGVQTPQVSGYKLLKFRGTNSSSFGVHFLKTNTQNEKKRRFHPPNTTTKNIQKLSHTHRSILQLFKLPSLKLRSKVHLKTETVGRRLLGFLFGARLSEPSTVPKEQLLRKRKLVFQPSIFRCQC